MLQAGRLSHIGIWQVFHKEVKLLQIEQVVADCQKASKAWGCVLTPGPLFTEILVCGSSGRPPCTLTLNGSFPK